MADNTKASNDKFNCVECQNENELDKSARTGDIVECSFCGIEYEITSGEDGNFEMEILEEEK